MKADGVSVPVVKDVDNHDFVIKDSAMSSHHSIIDPYAVSVDSKLSSYCNVISTIRIHYPEVLEFMMKNKSMVKVIHDVTFDMHSATKQDSGNVPITRTISSSVVAKHPPMTEVKYPDIGKKENFLQYILRCGGTSTESAAVVLSRVFKRYPLAFVKNDVALVHVIEFIIFATALSHRFQNILSHMIEKKGEHSVAYFGVKIARFMDICIIGDSRGTKKGPQAQNKLSVEHHVLIGILSDFKDIVMFKSNKMLDTEQEKALCIKMGGSCRFRSKFMGWFGGLKTSEERRSDIIAMKEIIPYYIGMELEKKDMKKKTDNKKRSVGAGKS